MAVFPFTYRKARFQHSLSRGYWVTLYCLFDGVATYTFFNNSECIENGSLLLEIDNSSCTYFQKEILVTPDKHPSIFDKIEDFENVLASDFN